MEVFVYKVTLVPNSPLAAHMGIQVTVNVASTVPMQVAEMWGKAIEILDAFSADGWILESGELCKPKKKSSEVSA